MSTNTAEVLPVPHRKGGMPRGKITSKTATAIQLIADHNFPADAAYRAAHGIDKSPNRSTLSRIRQKAEAWSIVHPKAQKIAHKTLRAFAAGNKVGEVTPNASACLDAAKRIIDQVSPVLNKSVNLNISAEYDDLIDLDLFRNE